MNMAVLLHVDSATGCSVEEETRFSYLMVGIYLAPKGSD